MTYSATNGLKRKPLIGLRVGGVIFFIITLLLIHLIWDTQWLEKNTSLTGLFHIRGEIAAPNDVVIISLNSAAAERLGYSRHSYTWPRTVYAHLLEQLKESEAEVVIMDIAFKAPRDDRDDSALERALASYPNVILYKYLKRRQIPTINGVVDVEEEIPPIPRFQKHALASGFFILPKANGKLFSTPLFLDLPSGPQPSQPILAYLALQPLVDQNRLWQAITGRPLNTDLSLEERAKKLYELVQSQPQSALPPRVQPLYDAFRNTSPMLINFYGRPQSLNHVDIDRVLAMDADQLKLWFDQKIIYVGYLETWQTEQQDAYTTVYTSANGVDISGVEISATVLSNLLHQQNIRSVPSPLQWLINLFCFALALAAYQLSGRLNAALQSTAVLSYLTLCYLLFVHFYLWLPMTIPMIAIAAGNAIQLVHHYRINRHRLNSLRYTLAQYLPHEAANQLSHNMMALEKTFQVVSGVALMSDIKGYTSLSESMPPDELHSLMNRYYESLISIVQSHEGFVANIVGDSLLALWTGPQIDADLCDKALRCAESIQSVIHNDAEIAELLPTCIAIHGGQFSLGNLGAQGHFEYSPVGDIINTTSRIEHFNRELNTKLLISQNIADQLSDQPEHAWGSRYLGAFNMRNKAAAVALYTHKLSDQKSSESFNQAIDLFQKHQFSEAQTLFQQVVQATGDGPSDYYIKACAQQLASKPKPPTI